MPSCYCNFDNLFLLACCLQYNDRWMTVGEFFAIVLWFIAMAIQMWQAVGKEGSHYNENVHPCPDNPSRWCSKEDGLPVATPAQWR